MEGGSAKEAFGKVCCLSDVSVCLPEQVYMHHMSVVAHRGKEKKKGVESSGTGITNSHELHIVGAGN